MLRRSMATSSTKTSLQNCVSKMRETDEQQRSGFSTRTGIETLVKCDYRRTIQATQHSQCRQSPSASWAMSTRPNSKTGMLEESASSTQCTVVQHLQQKPKKRRSKGSLLPLFATVGRQPHWFIIRSQRGGPPCKNLAAEKVSQGGPPQTQE